jgi:hypothetical protein
MQTVKEKLSFKLRETVEIDGQQMDFFTKCSVNFEKGTYKVTPVVTTQHGTDTDFFETVAAVAQSAAIECKKELDAYNQSMGIGVQGDLFAQPEYETEARAAA